MTTYTIVQPIEIEFRIDASSVQEAREIAQRYRDEHTLADYVNDAREVTMLAPRVRRYQDTEV